MGAEEERAMATTIASAKAMDMAKKKRWREGEGNNKEKWNIKIDKTAYKMETVKGDSTWNRYVEGGGGGLGKDSKQFLLT